MLIHEVIIRETSEYRIIDQYFFVNKVLAEQFIEDIKNGEIPLEDQIEGKIYYYDTIVDGKTGKTYGQSIEISMRKHILLDMLPKYDKIS